MDKMEQRKLDFSVHVYGDLLNTLWEMVMELTLQITSINNILYLGCGSNSFPDI